MKKICTDRFAVDSWNQWSSLCIRLSGTKGSISITTTNSSIWQRSPSIIAREFDTGESWFSSKQKHQRVSNRSRKGQLGYTTKEEKPSAQKAPCIASFLKSFLCSCLVPFSCIFPVLIFFDEKCVSRCRSIIQNQSRGQLWKPNIHLAGDNRTRRNGLLERSSNLFCVQLLFLYISTKIVIREVKARFLRICDVWSTGML